MITLNEHGAAARCLLRLRENEGKPGLSDAAFVNRFLPRYPEWQERPGAADASVIFEVARELGLAERMDVLRDYDAVLEQHQAGRSILVSTERVPSQVEADEAVRRYTLMLVAMDADGFTLWCPYPSGQADTLPRAPRVWWDRWRAIGLILQPPSPSSS